MTHHYGKVCLGTSFPSDISDFVLCNILNTETVSFRVKVLWFFFTSCIILINKKLLRNIHVRTHRHNFAGRKQLISTGGSSIFLLWRRGISWQRATPVWTFFFPQKWCHKIWRSWPVRLHQEGVVCVYLLLFHTGACSYCLSIWTYTCVHVCVQCEVSTNQRVHVCV